MSSQVEELTILCASEGGKPYIDSKVEIQRAINGVKLLLNKLDYKKVKKLLWVIHLQVQIEWLIQ